MLTTSARVGVDFAAPLRLWLLVLVAGLAVAYLVLQGRRRRVASRFASPALLAVVAPRRPGWWRHLIAGVLGAGLVVAVLGAAQPTVPGEAQREQATVIVAIDNSDSMAATDVAPDRITAAVAAATAFVDDLPSSFSVGLVTASGTPQVLVPPTTDHQVVQRALGGLELHPNTALGEAIFTSLASVPSSGEPNGGDTTPAATVVLLSDGTTTSGRPDEAAVAAAVEAGVPVSTIAFGTDDPGVAVESQGVTVPVPVDESALRRIAEGTGGTFFNADSTDALHRVYAEIDADVTVVATDEDIAEWFAVGALVLLGAAAVASLLTTSRVVWT
ncbi:MAG: VWA domain-containing protein [Acidimicrobiia bacterium]